MATRATSLVSALGLLAGALSACTPRPDGPAPTAAQFLAELGRGDTAAAAQLADHPADAHDDHQASAEEPHLLASHPTSHKSGPQGEYAGFAPSSSVSLMVFTYRTP